MYWVGAGVPNKILTALPKRWNDEGAECRNCRMLLGEAGMSKNRNAEPCVEQQLLEGRNIS